MEAETPHPRHRNRGEGNPIWRAWHLDRPVGFSVSLKRYCCFFSSAFFSSRFGSGRRSSLLGSGRGSGRASAGLT